MTWSFWKRSGIANIAEEKATEAAAAAAAAATLSAPEECVDVGKEAESVEVVLDVSSLCVKAFARPNRNRCFSFTTVPRLELFLGAR